MEDDRVSIDCTGNLCVRCLRDSQVEDREDGVSPVCAVSPLEEKLSCLGQSTGQCACVEVAVDC